MSSMQLSFWDNIPSGKWRNFKDARIFVRKLSLSEIHEWDRYISGQYRNLAPLPEDIPYNPDVQYKNSGWEGWDDWLGITSSQPDTVMPINSIWDMKEKAKWRPFPEARKVSWEYEFEYKEEWDAFIMRKFPDRKPLPEDIPKNPDVIYRYTGWKGWSDWLVPKEKRKEYTSFSKTREFVHCLRLKDISQWRSYLLSDEVIHTQYGLTIPGKPDLEYRGKGWKSWNDWLGTDIKFKDYATTRSFIKSLKIKNKSDWRNYCNNQLPGKNPKPENIYSYPEIAYRNDGWKDWNDWLGTGENNGEKLYNETGDTIIECRCRGRIPDCPECDGKGYISLSE